MNRIEDISRVKEALKELNQIVNDSEAEDIWEEFSHDAFEKSWLSTTEEGLALYKEKVKDINLFFYKLTPEKIREYDEPFIYFLLWIIMIYQKSENLFDNE